MNPPTMTLAPLGIMAMASSAERAFIGGSDHRRLGRSPLKLKLGSWIIDLYQGSPLRPGSSFIGLCCVPHRCRRASPPTACGPGDGGLRQPWSRRREAEADRHSSETGFAPASRDRFRTRFSAKLAQTDPAPALPS